jgi:diacylglycerol kinase
MLLVFASGLSLVVELLNTALEAAVDHTSLEIHPLAKRAKDAGSAAQYTCLTFIAILWGMAVYACLTA